MGIARITSFVLTTFIIATLIPGAAWAKEAEQTTSSGSLDFGSTTTTPPDNTTNSPTTSTTVATSSNVASDEVKAMQDLLSEMKKTRADLIAMMTKNPDSAATIMVEVAKLDEEIATVEKSIMDIQAGFTATNLSCEAFCHSKKDEIQKILDDEVCMKNPQCAQCKTAFVAMGDNFTVATGGNGDMGQRCIAYEEQVKALSKLRSMTGWYIGAAAICATAGALKLSGILAAAGAALDVACQISGVAILGIELIQQVDENGTSADNVVKRLANNKVLFGVTAGRLVVNNLLGQKTQKAVATKLAEIIVGEKARAAAGSFIAAALFALKINSNASAKSAVKDVQAGNCGMIEGMLASNRSAAASFKAQTCTTYYGALYARAQGGTPALTTDSPTTGNKDSGKTSGTLTDPVFSTDKDGNPVLNVNDPSLASNKELSALYTRVNEQLKLAAQAEPSISSVLGDMAARVRSSGQSGGGLGDALSGLGSGLTADQTSALGSFDPLAAKLADKTKSDASLLGISDMSSKPGLAKGASSFLGDAFSFDGLSGGDSANPLGDTLDFNGVKRSIASDNVDVDSIHLNSTRSIFKIVSDRIAVKTKEQAMVKVEQTATSRTKPALENKRLPASSRTSPVRRQRAGGL